MPEILLLEDDRVFSKQISTHLESEGFNIVCFAEVVPAMVYIEQNSVDLVIADLFIKAGGEFIPKGGITLISQIRQIEGRDIPVIAISGSFSEAHGEHAQSTARTVGASVNLAKPFHPDELLKLVQEQLGRVPKDA